jgi:hypothetical protein
MESDEGEEDDTSCDESTSQVATNGKRRSTPTKMHTQVNLVKMNISEGRPAKIARSGNTTRSRKRSLHQTTMHDTNVTDSEHALGDDMTKTYIHEAQWALGLGFGEREDQKGTW